MDRLDRTERRIFGVLLEKQLAVPDSYPMTENALLAGCNQSSNRDPVMALEPFQLSGALLALQEKEWVARVEGGGRVPRYRHLAEDRLGIDGEALPVLVELLLRGPQAPGALKPRVARMGFSAAPSEVEAVLRSLAARTPALVEQLPRRPRERDHRWRHLLGDEEEQPDVGDEGTRSAPRPAPSSEPRQDAAADESVPARGDLEARVTALEGEVSRLRGLVERLLPR